MLPPQSQAMMQGLSQGNTEAQSILPSVYQSKGKAMPQNPFQGRIDFLVAQLLSLGQDINNQSDQFRDKAQICYKCGNELAKMNNDLNKTVKGDNESDAGSY